MIKSLGLRVCLAAIAAAAIGCGSDTSAPTEPTPPALPAIPNDVSPTLRTMLQSLVADIDAFRRENADSLPRNPQNAAFIQAKISMLQNASLPADIINGRRWIDRALPGMGGRTIPIGLLFPLDAMRTESTLAVDTLAPVLGLLEGFFDTPFPTPAIRVWYGFKIGNSGGGGAIYSEDRTTYESRTPATRLPFDAILCHELGHSYIGNESLNQFLELYNYNVARGASVDPQTWSFTRSWTPGAVANQDSAAVLDIYQTIGHDAMRRAYRAIYPLRPPYGSPLSQPVIDAFLGQVPASVGPQVDAKLRKIVF